jgi:hypothetical protein
MVHLFATAGLEKNKPATNNNTYVSAERTLQSAGLGDLVQFSMDNATVTNSSSSVNSTNSTASGPITMFVSSSEGLQELANVFAAPGTSDEDALEALMNNPTALREVREISTKLRRSVCGLHVFYVCIMLASHPASLALSMLLLLLVYVC